MKFLNLETGYSFDAAWTDEQQKGYIFWFPKEQSIDLIYNMPIAIITDDATPLQLCIENNDIFSFASFNNNTTNVDGYEFYDCINYDNDNRLLNITTSCEEVNGKYVHVFNVMCCSHNTGEFICKISINDTHYIKVGADFYGENESLYINLSNMGVEIPTGIQKTIYDSNVHEDEVDNILINRKFKELLSNYWDIVANKGSYKSLSNSLEWFEWDDILKIREIWKHNEANHTIFNDEDILSVFKDKIENTINNFVKTTYISLYCSLQDYKQDDNGNVVYDVEYNPALEAAVIKWSRNDVQLKIALLAQFFGIYFTPLYMSILHATAEDRVYTNTIKAIVGGETKRDDCFGDFTYVECNIKDNALFKLHNVRAQATNKTIFAYRNGDMQFGVDEFPKLGKIDNANTFEIFNTQYYTGPGVIVPTKLTIHNQDRGDFIKQTMVDYTTNTGTNEHMIFNNLFYVRNGVININFNMLLKQAAEYSIIFTFIFASGKTITRKIIFNVEDVDNLNINIYKIHAKDDTDGFTLEDFTNNECAKYIFKIQPIPYDYKGIKNCYAQYLPYLQPSDERYKNYNGIKLNRTVIVDVLNKNGLGRKMTDDEILTLRSIMLNDADTGGYIEFARYLHDGKNYVDIDGNPINKDNNGVYEKPLTLSYLIFVSKKFFAELPDRVHNNHFNYKFNIIRNDLGFYPQFHYLEKMEGNTIDKYTIADYEAVCCAAEINNRYTTKEFRYGHLIDTAEWTFFNHLTNTTTRFDKNTSSKMPFVANFENNALKPGYYDVSFKYSLTNGIVGECRLDSAFRIK